MKKNEEERKRELDMKASPFMQYTTLLEKKYGIYNQQYQR